LTGPSPFEIDLYKAIVTNDYELEVLLDNKRRFKVTAVQDNVVGTNRRRKVTIKRLITMEPIDE